MRISIQLKPFTDCVRTYSIDHGLDQIAEIARRHGMKVMQGLWLSSLPDLNRKQIDTAVALAKRYPDVIESVIVGNEVLLRGEMSAPQLVSTIRAVKAQVTQPVTYADVWEFWLRYREVASAVDFITVHILPYWEDVPIPVRQAANHVNSIFQQIESTFPGRPVLLGEFGWPSAGRMREGALPSPINQARAWHNVVALAKRQGFRANLIEAYDQPWKRQLEGTVGGHWGLFDAYQRKPKFILGGAVSNHPRWRWQAVGGVALALFIFAAAAAAGRRNQMRDAGLGRWLGIAGTAVVSGTLAGWTIANIPLESLTVGDWTRSVAWAIVAVLAPIVGAATVAARGTVPSFARILAGRLDGPVAPLARALGVLLIVLTMLAVQAALGLVFDPRYRDFPFAPLTGATVPFLLTLRSWPRIKQLQLGAETIAAATLALSAVYIVFNETVANWQALWFCAGLLALAVTLLPARDMPG